MNRDDVEKINIELADAGWQDIGKVRIVAWCEELIDHDLEQRDRITALESAVRIGILYVRDTAARTNAEGCWRDLDSIQKALLGPDPRALLESTTTEATP